jgi:hypothetical protein
VVLAFLAAVPSAAGAVAPRRGFWDSGGRSLPSVIFEVRGPAGRRTVSRVSVPLACRGEPVGWGASEATARVRSGGRFTLDDPGPFVVRGRFTGRGRAEVTVENLEEGCNGSVRYVVRHARRRVPVRTGRFLALLAGGAATAELEVSAFGRMVEIGYLDGSVAATCSDGSQRPLEIRFVDYLGLAAPIRPGGRFDLPGGAAGSSGGIRGSFDHGAVAAHFDMSDVLPDGTSCRARAVTLVGSLGYPFASPGVIYG